MEYLGLLITRSGIKAQEKKIQSILSMSDPKTTKQLRSFVGMIKYYKNLWPSRNIKMAPLTAMTGKGKKFKWTQEHSLAFQRVKDMVAQDTMLVHPNFNKPFIVHTDASNLQIGGVVSQDDKSLGYFSKNLNSA